MQRDPDFQAVLGKFQPKQRNRLRELLRKASGGTQAAPEPSARGEDSPAPKCVQRPSLAAKAAEERRERWRARGHDGYGRSVGGWTCAAPSTDPFEEF